MEDNRSSMLEVKLREVQSLLQQTETKYEEVRVHELFNIHCPDVINYILGAGEGWDTCGHHPGGNGLMRNGDRSRNAHAKPRSLQYAQGDGEPIAPG